MGPLTRSHFTREFCDTLVKQYGTPRNAAVHIYEQCVNMLGQGAALTTVGGWINQGLNLALTGREDESKASRIEKLLEKANIPIDSIGNIDKVTFSQWGYQQKDKDGNPIEGVLDSTQISLTPKAPAFPVAQAATPNTILFSEPPNILKSVRTVVVVSDTQIGFLQDPETKAIEPIHDPVAMRVAEQIVHAVDPSEVVYIGDWTDLPFLSRFTQHDQYDAVNESIQEAYNWLCRYKAACREGTKFTMIGGNHDIRPEKFLLEHNKKALRIRRAADTSDWPVFSMPYLLRYEELGIHMPGHYPGGEYYITPDLVATHAPPGAHEFAASVIHGHTHKISRTPRVQHSYEGRLTRYTYDVGCLCQLGTTDDPKRLMRTRVPSDRARTNWQNGIAVINIVEGFGHEVEQIEIKNGKALYRGDLYHAEREEAS